MISIIRFRNASGNFAAEASQVIEYWRSCPGCDDVELNRNLDDPELWALVSLWKDVGSYRRSFGGYEAKMVLTPLLAYAIDEPTAYLNTQELSEKPTRFALKKKQRR